MVFIGDIRSKLCTEFYLAVALVLVGCNTSKKTAPMSSSHPEKIKVIAHRGGAKLAPENTLAAIKQAVDLGVDMIEIDVILSKDGEIIVIHDSKIDRTTNGSGVVKEMTLAEIKRYDAGSWFDAKFAGEKVPTLAEVFSAINGRSTLLIEIKDGDEAYPGLERKVVDAIHQHRANAWVIVQSFNEASVLRVKAMDSSLITYYLMSRNFPDFYKDRISETVGSPIADLPYDGLAVHHNQIDPEKVSAIHRAGFKLLVWTVNAEEDMQKSLAAGVDGIITDRPDQLLQLLDNSK